MHNYPNATDINPLPVSTSPQNDHHFHSTEAGVSEEGYLLSDLSGSPYPGGGGDSSSRKSTCQDVSEISADRITPRNYPVIRFWAFDIMAIIFVFGALGAIYGLLRRYDNQQVPDWDVPINLNTVVAILSTLIRASLVFIIADVISQAKWAIFRRDGLPQPLIRMDQLDKASRSLLDAMKLVPVAIKRPMLLLSIIVALASLAIGPFTQQAIRTEPCQIPSVGPAASIPVSYSISSGWNRQGAGLFKLDGNVQAALVAAAAASETTTTSLTYDCMTGNCSFSSAAGGIYGTLGICNKCADTSSLILRQVGVTTFTAYNTTTYNYSLPNGMQVTYPADSYDTLIITRGSGDLLWAEDLISSEMLEAAVWAYANVTVLTMAFPADNFTDLGDKFLAHAATCTLYPCLQSYTANIIDNSLQEQQVGAVRAVPELRGSLSASNISLVGASWDTLTTEIWEMMDEPGSQLRAIQSPCLINTTVWTAENMSLAPDAQALTFLDFTSSGQSEIRNTSAPLGCLYDQSLVVFTTLQTYFQDTIFNGSCIYNTDMSLEQVECGTSFWLDPLYNSANATASSIISQIEGFSRRVTSQFREGLAQDTYGSPRNYVSGQTLQMAVCINVSWDWLIFPLAISVTTAGLLIWIITHTCMAREREMVWKSSVLPLLFYGDQFVTQNAEDMSSKAADSAGLDHGGREPLLDIHVLEYEARQRIVQFR